MTIRETSISFPTVRGSGPQTANATIVFPRNVTKAVAAIRGYQVGFAGDDHHVGILQVELATTITANVVQVTSRLGCRDWSGNWDDEYRGSINVTVIAELVSPSARPSRGDLQIIDMEANQATQFFRSAEHLDAPNVMPDNSMPLVGGKSTGLRFWVDYDASSGLPPITNLSGELTVRSGGAVTTSAPLAPITPRRETEIDRAQVGHTLNFAIPSAWCRGAVEVSLQVFDQANSAQRSAPFIRTLHFVDVNPLRVYGVGINYTGLGLNLPAPTVTDLVNTFAFTRKVWPTGDVLTSGFTEIEFGQNLAGNAADGCGSGFNALLDDLKDLRGDTDDLVYGLLPTGTPLTGVGGCGGGGAGTGMVSGGVTAAHEAGHAVGRKHAPCDDAARCDSPQNQDDDYPEYGNFVSDSIGEFGFDPATNTVHDPAARRDFMGYSGSDWISPYTYKALFTKGDPTAYTPAALRKMSYLMRSAAMVAVPPGLLPGEERAEWRRHRRPLLFLSLWVDGDEVTLRPSFTFPAHIRRPGPRTDFEVHLEDGDGRVLACVSLQQACAVCDVDCGPVQLQGEVPWEDEAVTLVLRRDGTDIKRFEIEEAPKLKVSTQKMPNGETRVSWKTAGGVEPLHHLLQWEDYDGAWRGVAPRTTANELTLPARFAYARRRALKLRLLAVHMLRTASEEFEVATAKTDPPTTIDVTFSPTDRAYRAVAVDPMGRAMPGDDLVWYDESRGEILRGAELPLRITKRQGVAKVLLDGSGITAAEGFALLDPRTDDDREVCGCRPGGAKAREVLEQAGLIEKKRER